MRILQSQKWNDFFKFGEGSFRMLIRCVHLIGLSACVLISSSYAFQNETLENLNNKAVNFIKSTIKTDEGEKLEIQLGEAASQLQVSLCDQEIHVRIPDGTTSQSISTLQMSCDGQVKWNVYVPINMKILTQVVVTKQTISAKEMIDDNMLDYAFHDKNSLYAGYFKNFSDVTGQSAISTMLPGMILTKRNIQKPILINRNQIVSIIARNGSIMVKAEGVAKSNGSYNDVIKVMNASSKKVIDAVVVSGSSVEVR